MIRTVLLRPLPYPQADRLVAFSDGITASSAEHFKPNISGADFAQWRAQARSFDKMAGYDYRDVTLATAQAADRARIAVIAGDFWAITGARAARGRLFEPSKPQNLIVLSHSLFVRRFHGDPGIVGKVVTLDGTPVTVAGVLPPDFRFLFPQDWKNMAVAETEAFVPAPPLVRSPPSRLFVVARLKPLVPIQSALAELQGIEATLLKSYPDRWLPGISRMELLPLQIKLAGSSRQALLILQAAGILVLLIACVNITNLLLARGAARVHEIAIRTALGAGAVRVLRQLLAEGLLLALLGGAAGLFLAQGMIRLLVHFGPHAVSRLPETTIDGWVLAFTFGLCLGSGIIFSFGPALTLWKESAQNALKEDTRSSSASLIGLRVRRFLVASELALALVLLMGAGLMLKSFWRMYVHPTGFSPENTLVLKVSLSGPQYAGRSRQVAYFQELLHRMEPLPGVQAFGIANVQDYLLQSANSSVPNVVDQFRESLVSPGYFRAMGMQLMKGNWLTPTDPPDATIINETMARRAFGSKDPIGKRIDRLGRPVRVVGVVANLKYVKRDAEPGPEIFRAYRQNLSGGNITMLVAARLLADPLEMAQTARRKIAAIDPTQPVYDIQTLEQVLTDSIAARRFQLFLLGTFATAALLMALVGVYGVMAYSVTQRTREIGIRMALGAQRSEVLRLMIAQGIRMTLWGMAAGIGAALVFTRLMVSLLYEVAPNDLSTFGAILMVLVVTVLLASWVPAFQASRLDPQTALRQE